MTEAYETSIETLNANGIAFHYALTGDSSKPTLALVNPASHNLTCWEPVLADLEANFQVLRFDIRGTGKSGWGAESEFTFTQYAADLAAIMDALNIPKAIVVGVAYGARTVAQFALNHADKLTAFGMFDVALTPPVEQTGQQQLGAQARELLSAAGEPAIEQRKSWRFYENRDAAFLAHTAHQSEPDTSEMLGNIPAPALVVCGRQDMNLAEAQRIAGAIEGSTFHIMEMTGHASLFYRPTLFVELIRDFAANLNAATER